MSKENIFFCKPQQAYMRIGQCQSLRDRPVGKAAAGTQPKLMACERCEMFSLVDKKKVPTVSIIDYLDGSRPDCVSF